jgi:ABC-type multidrug transport system permease subunit
MILCYFLSSSSFAKSLVNEKNAFYYLLYLIIITILFICSFYGLIISQEKQSGLRFYLKAKNITPWVYINGNLIADTLLGSICMIIIISGSMWLISLGEKISFNMNDFYSAAGILCLWKMTFVL